MSWNEVNKNDNDKNTLDYTKFEEGKAVVIRVMDGEPVSKWRHWLPMANRSVTCIGKGCPICESIKKAKDAGVKPTFANTKRHTLHVYNYNTKKIELLEQGKTFFESLLMYMNNIGDLRTFDLKIIRSGRDTDTTYTFIPLPVSEVKDEIKDMYEANKVDLVDLLKPYTYEQTKGLMEGKDAKEVFANSVSMEGDEEVEVE